MKKILLALLIILSLADGVYGQRRDFHKSRYGGSGIREDANIITGSVMLGGIGLGYAFGLEYERMFGSAGRFSFALPLAFSSSNDAFMTVADVGDRYHYCKVLYMAPGLRYHPAGSYHKADFSLGVQLALGQLNVKEELITGISTPTTNYSSLFVAPMAALNLHLTAQDGFVFGWYVAAGPVVAGSFGLTYNGKSNNSQGFFQIGLKLGGRF